MTIFHDFALRGAHPLQTNAFIAYRLSALKGLTEEISAGI